MWILTLSSPFLTQYLLSPFLIISVEKLRIFDLWSFPHSENFTSMGQFSIFLCPLHFLQIGSWIQGLHKTEIWSLCQDYRWGYILSSEGFYIWFCSFCCYQLLMLKVYICEFIRSFKIVNYSISTILFSFISWNILYGDGSLYLLFGSQMVKFK